MARLPWSGIVFAVISAVFSLLIILSGVAGSAPLFFLQFNTQGYQGPARGSQLSSSQFLQDLSTVSGQDFVGSGSSGQTDHFADLYRVTLLTVCTIDNGQSKCSPPKLGFAFDVRQAFHLQDSMFEGKDIASFSRQMDAYTKVSLFMTAGYVIGTACTLLSIAFMFLAACFPKAASLAACATQTLAAVLLLAASIAAAVMFYRLEDIFDATLGSIGIQTSVSWRIMVFSFVSALESWLVLVFVLGFRKSIKRRRASAHGMAATSSTPLGHNAKVHVTGSTEGTPMIATSGGSASAYHGAAAAGMGFLKKLPTWKRNQQRYTEVEKQQGGMAQTSTSYSNGSQAAKPLAAQDEDEDFSHGMPDDVSQGGMGYNQRDPAARYDDPATASSKAEKTGIHADTAYDPYRK
ncbi:SUR7/PalI family [Microdochium nivale]|nr:SUR7/PalI family [Microdochium nivale]